MSMFVQNIIVLLAVAACLWIVGYQAFKALNGRTSKLGGCGVCGGCGTTAPAKPQAAERIVMVSLDSLSRRRPKVL